jgi:hypothetical protein
MGKDRSMVCVVPETDMGFHIRVPEDPEERKALEDNLKKIMCVDEVKLIDIGKEAFRVWVVDNKHGLAQVPLVPGTQDDDCPQFENQGGLPDKIFAVVKYLNPNYFNQPTPVASGGEMRYYCSIAIYKNKAAFCSHVSSPPAEAKKLEDELRELLESWGVPPNRITRSKVSSGQPQLYITTKPKHEDIIRHKSVIGRPDRAYAVMSLCKEEIVRVMEAEKEYREAVEALQKKQEKVAYEIDNGGS